MVSNKKKRNTRSKHTGTKSSRPAPQTGSKIFPTFDNKDESKSISENLGIYERYKVKTSSFCNSLVRLLPEFKLKSVSDLKRATDKICNDSISSQSKILGEEQLLHDLKESIKLRKEVGKKYGDDNKGHKFMLVRFVLFYLL